MEAKEQGDFLSQQCCSCDGSLVTSWCLDCNEALCDSCVLAHRRVRLTRSHRLVNQPQNDYNLVPPIKFCRLHPSESLQLFCFTCKQLTCRDCQLVAHKDHRFNFFSKVMDYLRKQLDNTMQPIKAQIEASRKSLQDMETRLLFLTQCEVHLTNSLQEIFNTLARLLKARSDRIIKEIQKLYNLEREMINGRMLKVKQMQEGHRSVSEAAAKAQNTTDLPLLVNYINQIRSQVMDLAHQDSSPPPHMIFLKVTTDQNTVEGMLNFGKLLYSWIPFEVSQEFKEKEAAPPASSSSSPSLTIPSVTTSQPLTTTSNSVHVSNPVSPPGSHRTTSSSLDLSSSLSTSSSKTSLQTGTCQSWPSLPTSSDLFPSPTATHSPTLTCSSPNSELFTRTGKYSGVPAATEASPSVSPSTQLHLHPSSTCPPPSSSTILQTGSICDFPKSSASFIASSSFMVPPSSIFGSPDPTEPIPKTTTPETSTPVSTSLIPAPSQSMLRNLGFPLARCPSCACFHSISNICPSRLRQVLNNQSHLLRPTSSLEFPLHTPSPLHLAATKGPETPATKGPETPATKGPETPAINATPTKGSDSTIRINILTKSQLESKSDQFWFKFKWKNKESSSKSSSSIKSSSRVCKKVSSLRCKNNLIASSSLPQTSLSPTTTKLPVLFGHLGPLSCIVSSSPTSSTCPASVNKDPSKIAPSAVQLMNVTPDSSIFPPTGPSLAPQKPLILDQLPVISQNLCAVDLLTNPQTAPPSSSSGIGISSSFIPDPPSSFKYLFLPQTFSVTDQPVSVGSIVPPAAAPSLLSNVSNHAQPLAVPNHNAVPSQENQPTIAPLTNPKPAYLMSGSRLSSPHSPQPTVLQNDFSNHIIPTTQESCDGPQISPVSLDFQAVPTTALEDVVQDHSVPTNQQTPTDGSCAAPDKQLPSDQNSVSNSGPGPPPLNDQKQNLELKTMADLNHGVQHQEPQQQHEVDTNTSVSESVAVGFGGTGREEELSSAETAAIKQTSVLPEETDLPKPYEVTPNRDSEEMKTVGGTFSPVSSEENLLTVPPEETEPTERQNPLIASETDPVTLKSEEMELYGGPLSPISSEEELTIVLPEETDPAGKQPKLAIVEDENVESEALEPFGGPFSPVSSEDDLIIVSQEETSPTEKQFSHKVPKIESDTIKSEDMEPYGRPFSPVSSEDDLIIVSQEETSLTEKQSSHKVESDAIKSEDMEPYGRPFSPVSSEEDLTIVRPVQTDPEEKQPTTEISEVKPTFSSGLFSPASSEDALTSALTDAPHFTLNLDETSDSESEEPQSFRTKQQDLSQSQFQPTVSLVRLPVSHSGCRHPPSFQNVLGDKKDELYLQESFVDVDSDVSVDSDNGSDITEDFTNASSSGSPMSVEIISCSACASANASKICCACGRGYHINCHVPPAGTDIWSEWTCSLCQDLSDPSDPYSSDRPKSPECTGLSLQDQRRCETLLLHLKVEGCSQLSQSGLWSDVALISERLTHRRPPPYQTAAQFASDLWTLFQDASQDEELKKLQASFQRKLIETLGEELPLSLLIAPASASGSAGDPISSVSSARNESEVMREEGDFKEVRKRLRDFLDLNVSSAFKRTKKE